MTATAGILIVDYGFGSGAVESELLAVARFLAGVGLLESALLVLVLAGSIARRHPSRVHRSGAAAGYNRR